MAGELGEVVKKVFQNSSVIAKQNTGGKFLKSSIQKALLSTLLLSPALVQALGLGGMTTNSALNEPFDAKIQLLNTNSEELQTLTVNLGDSEQFKSAGIERPFLLSSLKFEIIEGSSGSYLHITSNESIKEPFLNFLLEVNWAKGRLIREYTALLDPPVFDTNTRVVDTTELPIAEPVTEPVIESVSEPLTIVEPITTPVKQEQVENIRIEQLPDATLVSEAEVRTGSVVEATSITGSVIQEEAVVYQEILQQSNQQPSASSGASAYTTSKGDTLWSIASKSRPNRSVNVQQMMLSLLNSNPHAFVNNNINALKTGQVLKIPDHDEVNQISKREAIALVKEHNALWDDYRQGLASNVAVRPEGAVSSTGTVLEEVTEEEVLDEPEVRLVSATKDITEISAAGDNEQAITQTLENDLALAAEQLVSGENENTELKDKLKESEEIVDLLKQQVDLKNQELAALQLKLREANVSKTEAESLADEEAKTKLEAESAEEAKLAEEAKTKLEAEANLETGEEADDQSIDDILAELEGETDTSYLDYEQELATTATTYEEYSAPAENLSGKDVEAQYFSEGAVDTDNQREAEAAVAISTEDVVEDKTTDSEADTATTEDVDLLTKLKGLLPEGIVDSIPGGIKAVLAIALGLLGLLLIGVFKLFGKGRKEDAETLDLLDPDDLAADGLEVEDSFATRLDDLDDNLEENLELDDSVEEALEAPTDFEELEADVEEEFNFEFDEEELEEGSDLLDADEEELPAEGLVNLEDTLEQIKPLLEQTEEDGPDDDPLEEVNLSLAYEQFDKAERLVNKAIEDNPEEDGYKLRLLEVHYAANNKNAYEKAAKSLQEVTDGEGHLWESAVAMWSEMSPERDLFESQNAAEATETTISEDFLSDELAATEPEAEDVFDISGGAGIVAGLSTVGAGAALLSSDDEDEFINIADETISLEDTTLIDISSGDETNAAEVADDFINIAETGEVSEDFLNIAEDVELDSEAAKTVTSTSQAGDTEEFELSLDSSTDIKIDEGLDFNIGDSDDITSAVTEAEDDTFSIDMLDITAVGSTSLPESEASGEAEDFLELTNEFKTVDENIVASKTAEPSAEILEFTTDDLSENSLEVDDLESLLDADTFENSSDDLESLAKSLEDTISGLDTGGLDDLTFEFDTDGTLEKTLTSTLGVSDLDLENEGDEIDTKLNLAKAYIELGDSDGAKDILHEVSADGNDNQRKDAQELLQQIS